MRLAFNASRVACGVLLAACLAQAAPAAAVAPASWNETGFAVDARGLRLARVLEQFGAAYGVQVDSRVPDALLAPTRIKAASGTEFLDRLAASAGFRWFVYNETVYIVPRGEQISVRLQIGEDAVQDAKAALTGVGLFDARFGWGELPDEGVIIVSGPRVYVDLVRSLLLPERKPDETPASGRQVMVFRLKYASAADRTITTRGQKELVPGIKSILARLLDSDPAPRSGAPSPGEFDVASSKPSRRGPVGKAGEPPPEAPEDRRGARAASATRAERVRIDADPSLNAIIIYDDVARRATYQSLIAQLDVEPRQVEIEALIVDIDRSKLSELGVEWGVRSGSTSATINAGGAESQGVELPLPGSTLLINNAGRFYARLKAMEGSGDARVLAKPTVLTLDNVAAVLDLSQTAYVPLVGERVADLADITVGTMLRVVPRIVQEGASLRVRLEIDIEDGAMDKNTGKDGGKSSVTRSTISSQAIVDAQQTLMIGGYHAESVSRQNQKVPVLGDVPLLGGLFRSASETHSTRERLFLITPRIMSSAGMLAAEQSKANKAARRLAASEQRQQARSGEAPVAASAPVAAAAAAPVAAAAPLRRTPLADVMWPKKPRSVLCRRQAPPWR
ncbi:EscC/YscC/HrcC family type III secretion system outer membrane ring protein [Massilia sp. CCM 8733]|uniref:Type 3 secretion system secretin n=2 Tax=Massilia mucilaginosa TaxID=2609282 RepID=A0ABX0NWS1_9BURK|nr:EscC/YscC/HrcC family type III secretion system outer membrane ring protein [Massilia mucilaginosa]